MKFIKNLLYSTRTILTTNIKLTENVKEPNKYDLVNRETLNDISGVLNHEDWYSGLKNNKKIKTINKKISIAQKNNKDFFQKNIEDLDLTKEKSTLKKKKKEFKVKYTSTSRIKLLLI